MAALQPLLRPAERAKAEHLGLHADRFLIGRGVLHLLLRRVLGSDDYSLAENGAGKPAIQGDGHSLHFNVSHSRETLLIALSRDRAVGVDVEFADPERRIGRIAQRFFSQEEFDSIRGHADAYRIWVRKEAWFKACGTGLMFPLSQYQVVGDAAGRRPAGAPEEVHDVSICEFDAPGGYPGAVACAGPMAKPQCWTLSTDIVS